MVAARRRGVVAAVGPRQAGDRAGARLRDGRGHRARCRLRPRLRRRGRAVQLPGGARAQPARLPVPPLAGRHACGDGAHAHRRRRRRARGGAHRHGQPGVPRGRPRTRDAGDGGSGWRRSRATSCRSTSGPCTGRWSSRACAPRRARVPSSRDWPSNLESTREFFADPSAAVKQAARDRGRRYFLNATGAVVLVLLAPGLDPVDVPAHEVVPTDQVLVAEVHEPAHASRPRRGTRGRARRCPRPGRASRCRWPGRARGSPAVPWRGVTPRRRAGRTP